MRQQFTANNEFVLCTTTDGWSLHAPGSTDEQIACGDAPYLTCGENKPLTNDFKIAMRSLCPWACRIVTVEGGVQAFESVTDYETWKQQR